MITELQWIYIKDHYKLYTTFPEAFLKGVREIINKSLKERHVLGDWEGKDDPKGIIIDKHMIKFNGITPQSHETFILELSDKHSTGNCKTNNYPYTTVIIEILTFAKEYGILKEFTIIGDTYEISK